MARHIFSDEQIKFVRDNAKGILSKDLMELFNAEFGLNLNELQIINAKKRNGIKSGPTKNKGQFKKGQRAFPKTEFKKGGIPYNHMPVGTETVVSDGYTVIKAGEPNIWRYKHLTVWEGKYGPVPKGKVVMFGDGDKTNFDIDNLILVTRRQLAVLGTTGMIQNDAELTRTAINIVDLQIKINEVARVKG